MCPFREGDETSDLVPARTIHGLLPLEDAMRGASGLSGWPDAPGLGACGVYFGDVRPVDIALAGAYLAGGGARPGSCRTARAGGHLRETNRFRSAGVPVG